MFVKEVEKKVKERKSHEGQRSIFILKKRPPSPSPPSPRRINHAAFRSDREGGGGRETAKREIRLIHKRLHWFGESPNPPVILPIIYTLLVVIPVAAVSGKPRIGD